MGQSYAYLKYEAPPESSSENGRQGTRRTRVVGRFSGGPLTTSQSVDGSSRKKKGNLECRLENSRGTFHCLVSRSTNGRAPASGGGKKCQGTIPNVDLRYASSTEKSNNITKMLTPLC